MKLRQFERSWHGIDFTDLPVKVKPGFPAAGDFYAAFYAELSRREIDHRWRSEKQVLGRWIEENFLKTRRHPRILSVAAGLAVAEQLWLERGYDVTLNECQAESLLDVQRKYPAAKTLIGNAHDLRTAERFDVVTVFTVDYALTDEQLLQMFTKLKSALAGGGIVINQTVNVLTLRRVAAEFIKRSVLGRYRKPGWVLWGWSRSPDSIIRIATRAGLNPIDQIVRGKSGLRHRSRLLWRFPPIYRQDVVMVFEAIQPIRA